MAPRWPRAASPPAVRALSGIVMGAAAIAVLWTAAFGDMRVAIGRSLVFKSTGAMRPMIALAAAGVLSAAQSAVGVHARRDDADLVDADSTRIATRSRQLRAEKHPLRDASECVQPRRAGDAAGIAARPVCRLRTDRSWHPIYYYFQRLQPWTEQRTPAPEMLDRNLHDPASFRPSLVQEDRYHDYLHGPEAARFTRGTSPPMIPMLRLHAAAAGSISRLQSRSGAAAAGSAATVDLVEARARGFEAGRPPSVGAGAAVARRIG